jgi:hypothetical protein
MADVVIVAVAVFFLGMGVYGLAAPAALLGMAFGRLVARAVERPTAFYPSWFYFWVETLGGSLLLVAAGW